MTGTEHTDSAPPSPMLRAVGELTISARELSRLIGGALEPGSDPNAHEKWRITATQGHGDAIRIFDALVDSSYTRDGVRITARDGSVSVLNEQAVSRLGSRLHRIAQVGRALGAIDATDEPATSA